MNENNGDYNALESVWPTEFLHMQDDDNNIGK
jgi:hypothetical protein